MTCDNVDNFIENISSCNVMQTSDPKYLNIRRVSGRLCDKAVSFFVPSLEFIRSIIEKQYFKPPQLSASSEQPSS